MDASIWKPKLSSDSEGVAERIASPRLNPLGQFRLYFSDSDFDALGLAASGFTGSVSPPRVGLASAQPALDVPAPKTGRLLIRG